MTKISKANIKKTIYYLKRNGLRDTFLAALERLQQKGDSYVFMPPSGEVLAAQKAETKGKADLCFSILVPVYHTPETYLRAMIESVLSQNYENFELILADAGRDDSVKNVADSYKDARIRYLRLAGNRGISKNTNEALKAAKGDYIGLLDHDDLLTADALYENYKAIEEAREKGICLKLIYSDEDKCNETGERFYEPHYKTDFNLDLFLSNNYICHFAVMEAALMKNLMFRGEYDGAQDYDIFLRAVNGTKEEQIYHIPKMLYHWRCHSASTAENPESKQYAYEAGRRALEDFCRNRNWKVKVRHTAHLGFYQVDYIPDILKVREDVAAVGGPLIRGGKIVGGIYDSHGKCPYRGLHKGFSGYLHRAVLRQDAYAVDVRNIRVRKEYIPLLEEISEKFWKTQEKSEAAYRKLSILFCRKLREKGGRIVYAPDFEERK